jgi:hypothetical protein
MNAIREADERVAPGSLALVQAFLNAVDSDPTLAELALAEDVRVAASSGEPLNALAARFGLSRQLVSAMVRRRRFTPAPSPGSNEQYAPSIGSVPTASDWLIRQGFLEAGTVITTGELRRLHSVRRALLELALANAGQPVGADAWRRLSGISAVLPLHLEFFETGSELLPDGHGADRFLGAILAAVHEARRAGTWERLKACPAEQCEAVFYDVSRNRTATWCSMAICGNRTKVRSYQTRRRNAVTSGS